MDLACPLAGGNRSNRLRRPPIRLARIDLGSSTSESSRQHPGQTRRWRPGKEAVTPLAAPGCRSPVCAKRRESVSAPSATAAIASTTTSVTRQRFEPADLKITIKRTCRHTFAEHSSRGRQNILTSGPCEAELAPSPIIINAPLTHSWLGWTSGWLAHSFPLEPGPNALGCRTCQLSDDRNLVERIIMVAANMDYAVVE